MVNYKNAKSLLDELDPDTKKNIKLVQISEKPEYTFNIKNTSNKVLLISILGSTSKSAFHLFLTFHLHILIKLTSISYLDIRAS